MPESEFEFDFEFMPKRIDIQALTFRVSIKMIKYCRLRSNFTHNLISRALINYSEIGLGRSGLNLSSLICISCSSFEPPSY